MLPIAQENSLMIPATCKGDFRPKTFGQRRFAQTLSGKKPDVNDFAYLSR